LEYVKNCKVKEAMQYSGNTGGQSVLKWQWYEQGKYDVLFTLNDYYIKTGKGLKELDKFVKWAKKQGGFDFDKKKWKQKQEIMKMVRDIIVKRGKK
jgi:hypothetical protein